MADSFSVTCVRSRNTKPCLQEGREVFPTDANMVETGQGVGPRCPIQMQSEFDLQLSPRPLLAVVFRTAAEPERTALPYVLLGASV